MITSHRRLHQMSKIQNSQAVKRFYCEQPQTPVSVVNSNRFLPFILLSTHKNNGISFNLASVLTRK